MKIRNIKYSLNELEQKFTKNFSSPIFPILAESYFRLSQFKKAKQVCEIGLSQNPDNTLAEYVLAKTYLLEDNYKEAEKLLKKVIHNNPSHFEGLMLFIDVEMFLKRSIGAVSNQIKKAYKIDPKNEKIQGLYNQLNIKQKKSSKNYLNKKKLHGNILINEKLATKTMYFVLMKQKKYNDALDLLRTMRKNKKNKSFVKNEYNKVLNLIKK